MISNPGARRLWLTGAVLTLALAATSVAWPGPTSWFFRWSDAYGGGVPTSYGTYWAGSDGYDLGLDYRAQPDAATPVAYYVRHVQGPEWSGPSGWYMADVRAPLLPGETKTWDEIYVWVWGAGYAWSEVRLRIRPTADPSYHPPADWRYTLCLDHVPSSVSYSGPWEWDIDPAGETWVVLPVYLGMAGTDGYRMHFSVTAIPEPSSLVAAGLGLMMVGLGLRRARRQRRLGEGGQPEDRRGCYERTMMVAG
jgi:hypothetical protein